MSRAFVKEPDGTEVEELTERPVSAERNFVTPEGLKQIEKQIAKLSRSLMKAKIDQKAPIARDLHYWMSRRSTAEVVEMSKDIREVHFGHFVTIRRASGKEQTYQLVGLDEADPKLGKISYISPLARELLGKTKDDVIELGGDESTIIAISKTIQAA